MRQYLSYFYSNLDIDGDNDAEVSENEEDEPEAAEIDPRYADEGEEDQPARAEPRAAQRPPGQPPGPWDDERWTEVVVEDNAVINRCFQRPRPAPFIPEVVIPGAGAKSIPVGTAS